MHENRELPGRRGAGIASERESLHKDRWEALKKAAEFRNCGKERRPGRREVQPKTRFKPLRTEGVWRPTARRGAPKRRPRPAEVAACAQFPSQNSRASSS